MGGQITHQVILVDTRIHTNIYYMYIYVYTHTPIK